jgi:hypothetical protein
VARMARFAPILRLDMRNRSSIRRTTHRWV